MIPFKKDILYKGVRLTVYSIGWLSLVTGRTNFTVRRWERVGLLPPPLINLNADTDPRSKRVNKTFRWYLAAEIIGFSENFKRAGFGLHLKAEDTSFKQDNYAFQTALKKVLLSNPKQMLPKLPNEKELEGAYSVNDMEAAKKVLRQLLNSVVK